MADTPRPVADLLALYGDELDFHISAQDFRDFVVSALPMSRSNIITIAGSDMSTRLRAQADIRASGTNDEEDFKTARDSLPSTGGTIVFIGQMNFDTSNPEAQNCGVLIDEDNIEILGLGPMSNITLGDEVTGSDRFAIGIYSSSNYGRVGWALRHFKITARANSHHGLRVMGSGGGVMEDLLIVHNAIHSASSDEGIQYAGDVAACAYDLLRNIRIDGFGGAAASNFEFAGGDNGCHDLDVIACKALNSAGAGFKFRTGGAAEPQRIHMSHCLAMGNAVGFNIDTSHDISADHCRAVANTTGFDLGTTSKQCRIDNSVAYLNDQNGFEINGTGHALTLNTGRNNGQSGAAAATNRCGFRLEAPCKVIGNLAIDDQGTPTQQRGFHSAAGANSIVARDNEATGNATNWSSAMIGDIDKVRSGGNVGVVLNNRGAAASVADGGTIAHGLSSTPAYASAVASVAGETVSVTGLGSTNITVAIKDSGGNPGTSQTVYWEASV